MKNSILLLVLSVVFLSSCEKEVSPVPTTNASTPVAVRAVNVDYTIYAASGSVELVYLINADGVLTEKTATVNRMNHTISFTTKSQQLISIKARNTQPSHGEVMVSIYVDGLLFRSNSTTGLNSWASASGTPQ